MSLSLFDGFVQRVPVVNLKSILRLLPKQNHILNLLLSSPWIWTSCSHATGYGRTPAPVEVGSLKPIIYRVFVHTRWWRIYSINSTTLLLSPSQPHQPQKSRYDHWMGETTRNISAFLSLGFGSSTVPFHILQADDMFYEEMRLGGSDERKEIGKKNRFVWKRVVK